MSRNNSRDMLLLDYECKVSKALARFEASFKRLPALKESVDDFTDEELGAYDEFLARFSRLADIFLNRYVRTRLAIEDPAFSGSLRDVLNFAEKLGIIDSAEAWYNIRDLQNKQAHEYEEEDLLTLFSAVVGQYQRVCSIKGQLNHASKP